MPPSPSRARTRYRSAITFPTSGSSPAFGRRGAPSLTQNREPVSYSAPHCGHTFGTAATSAGSGVDCWAKSPEPKTLGGKADGDAVGSTPAVASAGTGPGGAWVVLSASDGVGSIDGWSRSGSG